MNLKSIFGILCMSLIMMSCGSDSTEDFIGTWSGEIDCMGDLDSLVVVISAGTADDEVVILLQDTSPSLTGTVSGNDLTVEKSTIPDGAGETIDITIVGSLSDDGTLTLNFGLEFYQDGILEDAGTCLATLTQ